MSNTNIQDLTFQAARAFREQGYTKRSIEDKGRVLRKIVERHEQHGEIFYSACIVEQFILDSEKRYKNEGIQRGHYNFLTRVARELTKLQQTGIISFGKPPASKLQLSDYYKSILESFLKSEGKPTDSRSTTRSLAQNYFAWLFSKGHLNFDTVTESTLREYLIACSSRMVGKSLESVKSQLKKLYKYLAKTGLTQSACEHLLSFPVPIQKKIRRPAPHTEIAATLDAIDRSTPKGKRDYAAILLAVVTGLRAIDIVRLKLMDVDWRNGEIKIIQTKTEKALALPLTADVGEALRDYILHSRPQTRLSAVFLRTRAPFTEITPASLYNRFNIYRAKVGLSARPFYDLRRALGSNMVISGVPVTTVAQVLGHSSINPTQQYISLDTLHLKECALTLSGIELELRGGAAQ